MNFLRACTKIQTHYLSFYHKYGIIVSISRKDFMQSNNTLGENIQTNTSTGPGFVDLNAAAGTSQASQAPRTTPMNPGKDIVFRDKPKKNVGTMIGIIILIFLAGGGAGFGTWAYLSGNEKEANMNAKIEDLNAQLAAKPEVDETVVNVNTDSDVDTTNYIYIGEWGIKIKKPSELNMLSYLVDYRASEDGLAYLYVNGVYGNPSSVPSFINTSVNEYWLGCLTRLADGAELAPFDAVGDPIVTIDGFEYYYGSPNGPSSSNEQDYDLEEQSTKLINQMLTNPENYSKI